MRFHALPATPLATGPPSAPAGSPGARRLMSPDVDLYPHYTTLMGLF
jgi:hypothetical protein